MRRSFAWLASGLLAIVLATAACGGGDGGNNGEPSGNGNASPTATAGANSPTTTAGGQTATATATTRSGEDSAARQELNKLLEGYSKANYRVVYDIVSGSGSQTTSGTMVWYSKPPKFRFDFQATEAGQTQQFIFIADNETSYLCSQVQGQNACLRFPTGQAEQGGLGDVGGDLSKALNEIAEDIENTQVTQSGTRNIAGQKATCFTVTGRIFDVEQEGLICLSDDGVPLLIEAEGANGGTLEAKEFSKGVSDDDFKPPYPVQELPGTQPTQRSGG